MKNNPSICAIILNYKSYKDTISYVKQISLQKNINLSILIVDNDSKNNSYEILNEKYKNIENIDVIASKKNGGYSYGNNFGIKYIQDKEIDFILISNNDIIINDKLLLYKLSVSYKSCDDPAFIAPIMLDEQNKPKRQSAWKIPSFLDDLKNLLFLDRLSIFNNTNQTILNKGVISVDCLAGSFSLIKKNTLYRIGFFDETTFLYCEERINAFKIKKLKLNNYLATNLFYIHKESKTISRDFNYFERMKIMISSRVYFHQFYGKKSMLLTNLLWLCFYLNLAMYHLFKFFKNEK